MRYRWAGLAVIALAAVVAAGCGGKKDAESSKSACRGTATTAATNFPADFPFPGELTVTSAHKDGPTNVVDGYWASGLDEAYKEYNDAIEKAAGYKVLFAEHEDHDAEISYSGSGKTGQIALRDDCTESDTTRVHITSRPQ